MANRMMTDNLEYRRKVGTSSCPSLLLIILLLSIVLTLPIRAATETDVVSWDDALRQGAFVKEGLERFQNPQYQYECLGLGGTTMRVGPYGFTKPGAHWVHPNGYLEHQPYLAYQYWWDEEAHRHLPFDITGGYGKTLEPGQVTSFRQNLDIASGLLTIDLDLRADLLGEGLYQIGKNEFHTRREIFITPDGVLVMRITDSPESTLPIRMRVDTNAAVRIYLNLGIYKKEHEKWTGTAVQENNGIVVMANRPKSCVATLAVAVDASEQFVDAAAFLLGSSKPGQTLTFYIAPGSSYESSDPAVAAWQKAERAREQGYDALGKATAEWWSAFYGRSAVCLPDRTLATWYARSIYYHGVYFGNTDIPPGCNATSIESFAGAICPEYDLVFSQLALVYTNHFDESRHVADWVKRALPRADRYAKEGLTLHKVSVKYNGGAKFGTLMGYDGTILVPPTEGEGVNAYGNFAGLNAAVMALAYADWSGDAQYDELAKRVLKETTQVAVEDLQWRPDLDAYVDKNMPNTVQQSAAIFGVKESLRRSVAKPRWENLADKILMPTAEFEGKKVMTVGPGAVPIKDYGDATWLIPVWWYGIMPGDDPIARASYDLFRRSLTGKYIFNNGWMGVYAAKLRDGDEAYRWARQFLQPGVTLFDDTCFGEMVEGPEDFKKTPEIGAHGSLICNVTQMLLDPDTDDVITVFPAIPPEWERKGVAFKKLAVKGGILVSAEFLPSTVQVSLENTSTNPATSPLRVRLPHGTTRLHNTPDATQVKDGWAIVAVELQPHKSVTFTFAP
ncbi:MAG: hypothetical protein QG656_1745 [Candidatus Hydrogenedentes bacterium]|nr:hypothetical protein [Candidatus Hydrogenedentota bacterium]